LVKSGACLQVVPWRPGQSLARLGQFDCGWAIVVAIAVVALVESAAVVEHDGAWFEASERALVSGRQSVAVACLGFRLASS